MKKTDSIYQLIQFKNSLTREQMRILRENGLALNEYIPNFAYAELVGRNQLKKLQSLPFYRRLGNNRRMALQFARWINKSVIRLR